MQGNIFIFIFFGWKKTDICATFACQNFDHFDLRLGEMYMPRQLHGYFKKGEKQAELVCSGSVQSTRAHGSHFG